jgi:(E)-4-hydroxy-3-methylbut-2-enyl-diphosphate synthase
VKQTIEVMVGNIGIGGANPVRIQSMTDTDTADCDATFTQCVELIGAGAELVRVTVNNDAAATAVPEIRRELDQAGYEDIPLIGDFHHNGHILLEKYPEMAASLAKYRVNPGNVGKVKGEGESNFEKIIKIAIKNNAAVRIGVNWGSLEDGVSPTVDAIVESSLKSAEMAVNFGLPKNKIIISAKVSAVPELVEIYESLNEKCDYPLHLGLTEAGTGMKGLVSSSAALGGLLLHGIGDTIRISLTPAPGSARIEEVEACRVLLQSLGLRFFTPQVTSCPGCGRTDGDFYRELAAKINNYVKENSADWAKKYPGSEKLKLAVMGCIVNGPGESAHADIGIHLPGKFEKAIATVHIDGKKHDLIKGDNIFEQFIKILEKYLSEKF